MLATGSCPPICPGQPCKHESWSSSGYQVNLTHRIEGQRAFQKGEVGMGISMNPSLCSGCPTQIGVLAQACSKHRSVLTDALRRPSKTKWWSEGRVLGQGGLGFGAGPPLTCPDLKVVLWERNCLGSPSRLSANLCSQ